MILKNYRPNPILRRYKASCCVWCSHGLLSWNVVRRNEERALVRPLSVKWRARQQLCI